MPSKIQFSSSTNPFDPMADCLVGVDPPFLQPCMDRLVYDGGCDPFERCGFGSDDTCVEQASVQGMQIAASSMRNQLHPDSREVTLDTSVVKWSKALDQLKRGFNALQRGFRIPASDPKAIDHAAFGKPQRKFIRQRGSCRWRVARHGLPSLPTTLAYPQTDTRALLRST
jgi:hypothetical protein